MCDGKKDLFILLFISAHPTEHCAQDSEEDELSRGEKAESAISVENSDEIDVPQNKSSGNAVSGDSLPKGIIFIYINHILVKNVI